MGEAQTGFDSKINRTINKIRKLIEEKNHGTAVEKVQLLLAELMKEKYNEISQRSDTEKSIKMRDTLNLHLDVKKGKRLGLWDWINIYKTEGLFEDPHYFVKPLKFFTAEFLYKIIFLRNPVAHELEPPEITDIEMDSIFRHLVNIVKELGWEAPQKYHKLCQFCLSERSTKSLHLEDKISESEKQLKVCDKCYAVSNVLWKIAIDKDMRIHEKILELRCFFNKDLEDSYRKYIPDWIRQPQKRTVVPISTTKKEKQKMLQWEKRHRSQWSNHEKDKKIAMLDVYREEVQKTIFKLMWIAVKGAVKKDPKKEDLRESVIDDLISLFPDWDKILRIHKRSVLSTEELKTMTPESVEITLENRIRKDLEKEIVEKYSIFIEPFMIYHGVEHILDCMDRFFKSPNVIKDEKIVKYKKESLYHFLNELWDVNEEWPTFTQENLDPKILDDIVQMIGSGKELPAFYILVAGPLSDFSLGGRGAPPSVMLTVSAKANPDYTVTLTIEHNGGDYLNISDLMVQASDGNKIMQPVTISVVGEGSTLTVGGKATGIYTYGANPISQVITVDVIHNPSKQKLFNLTVAVQG